jgi:hypothetical protein
MLIRPVQSALATTTYFESGVLSLRLIRGDIENVLRPPLASSDIISVRRLVRDAATAALPHSLFRCVDGIEISLVVESVTTLAVARTLRAHFTFKRPFVRH